MKYDNLGDSFATVFTFSSITISFLMPALLLFAVTFNYNILLNDTFKSKFGVMYEELKLNSKAALLFNFSFLMRRNIFAIICVFALNYPAI